MAENEPKLESSEENVPAPVDPNEAARAVKDVSEAMAILPKKWFGCLARFAKYGAVLLLLLAAFVYWNFLRTPRLVISKETTYITEPLTADGTRVDYFAALEQELYPPEMKTDDNGYRMIVRAIGAAKKPKYDLQGNEIGGYTKACTSQVYEKLGLDPAIDPTMTCVETFEFLLEYGKTEGLSEEQASELDAKVYEPWTLDDLPMMRPWLKENGPVLDLVGEAERRPVFCFPMVRSDDEATLVEAIVLGEMQRVRSFARMLQARAYYRIGIGDIDGAIDDVITCTRLGRHVECQGMAIGYLVGMAIEGVAASIGVSAIRESQPTEEQLQRLVDEINSLPPRPDLERLWLAERYWMLDLIQSKAVGAESLAGLFSGWMSIEEYKPGIAAYVSADWNVVMRRVNEICDCLEETYVWQRPKLLSPGNLFIGVRSRRVGDVIAGMCLPATQSIRETDRRTDCIGNLHRITLAMLIYERRHGTLPPAYTVDAAGNPLHSWRVLLLPYIGEEELLGKLRLDEPWDSQHNRQFHDAALAIYQCPSAKLEPGQTTYSVVVGENTAFRAGEGKSLDDLGMILMLVVEREQAVCWMDPTSELTEVVARKGINRITKDHRRIGEGIGSPHPGGVDVGLRDGSVQFISETMELSLLQDLLDGTAKERRY